MAQAEAAPAEAEAEVAEVEAKAAAAGDDLSATTTGEAEIGGLNVAGGTEDATFGGGFEQGGGQPAESEVVQAMPGWARQAAVEGKPLRRGDLPRL